MLDPNPTWPGIAFETGFSTKREPHLYVMGSRQMAEPLLNVWYRVSHKAFALFWRIVSPTTVGVKVIATDSSGDVLLVKPRYHPGWNLPGGGVHKRESLEDAAVREMAEEVGLTMSSDDLRLLGMLSHFEEGKSDHIAVFHVALGGNPVPVRGIELEGATFFRCDSLPSTVSPATRRRLAEYFDGYVMSGAW